jgi:hypothetical protein
MRRLALVLVLVVSGLALGACEKKASPTPEQQKAATGKLAKQLLGKWNDQEDGSLAFEFLDDGKCKAFGDVDCKYEITGESGDMLKLKYNATDDWDEIELTFQDPDKASWKNVTTAKTDPDSATTKLVRVK